MTKSLATRRILVQALSWPNQSGSLRISVGDDGDTDAVLAAIADAQTAEHADD